MDVLAVFFLASIALGLAPGPDNIFVLTQAALAGPAAGLIVTLGLCTGLIAHTLAVTLGVAAVFQTSPLAFTLLKLAGAGYLLFLAWRAFRAAPRSIDTPGGGRGAFGRLYRRGIIMNITNPKVSVFFLAFLPQFADPARGSLSMQMMLLGAVFIFATILVFGSVALIAGRLRQWLIRSDRIQRIMNRVAGVIFIGLALKLVTTER